MTTESEKLLKAAGMGSVEAFEKLTEGYLKTVYNILLTSCGRQDNTSELAQEVFVRVFKDIKSFKNINSLGASVYKAARDVCVKSPDRGRKIS